MIRGAVDARWQAWIPVEVAGRDGQIHSLAAVLDTGFTGYLTLPPELIRRLDLELELQTDVTLATGVRERLDTWNGYILWHGRPRPVHILETRGTPLVGMRLMEGSQLTIQVRVNGAALIEEMDEIPP